MDYLAKAIFKSAQIVFIVKKTERQQMCSSGNIEGEKRKKGKKRLDIYQQSRGYMTAYFCTPEPGR